MFGNPQLIEAYREQLKGDEHLFKVVDLRLKPQDQKVAIVTGTHAEGFINNGHYHVEYHGENPSSKTRLRDKAIADGRAAYGEIALPKTVTQELEQEVKINEDLRRELVEEKRKFDEVNARLQKEVKKAVSKQHTIEAGGL